MNLAVDPWVITPREKSKYQEQFRALRPQNEIVTGAQAREFFLQSQLPPMVLGEIWALADTDSDGKMNIIEFSIACKLINLKLRGFEIPKALPAVLLTSAGVGGGVAPPTQAQIGNLSPLDPLKSITPQKMNTMPPARPQQPVLQQTILQQQPVVQQVIIPPMAMNQQPLIPGMGMMMQQPPPIVPMMQQPPPIIPMMQQPPPIVPMMQPIISAGAPTTNFIPPMVQQTMSDGFDLLGNKLPSPIDAPKPVAALPAPPTPPSGTSSRHMSISDKSPSIDSPTALPMGQPEWAIKGQVKLKYTQLFNTTDRTRSGFLTGAQARNLMVQTKLPQAILAQIWALSDMDSDGRLGCDEFVTAMYLCDLALQGETIPAKLSIELIPPSFRKPVSRHGSIAGTLSRHGSISSQGAGSIVDADPSAGLPGQTSFEDKRKENFDKGQAELERRRKVLLDIQRKEQEERERKEREEAEKREKARLEVERRQQEELERQLQRQREIEQEKEEKRKREVEQKEAARMEMEKQRQLEWEKQRIAEMQLQRQREQENVLKLKAKNQTFSIELSTLNEKIKNLSQKICDTRVGVTNVKTVIDGMRSTRDTQMTEMTQLKAQIKEQNQKLVHLSQEKAKMESKKKGADGTTNATDSAAAFSNKQILINQLRGKLDNTKEELSVKQIDVNTHVETLTDLKTELSNLINTCETNYAEYDMHRIQVMELKNNRKNESMTSAWDTTNAWPTAADEPAAISTATTTINSTPAAKAGGYTKYRAIYEFFARNSDEITFQPGDIIMVPLEQNAEPGWLAGEIGGHTGWFPETYVELYAEDSSPTTFNDNNKLEEIVEETIPAATSNQSIEQLQQIEETAACNGEVQDYISRYPYESDEIGDLTFGVGEHIKVIKKDGDWWTGVIGDTRTGIFPSNFVELAGESDLNDNVQNGVEQPIDQQTFEEPLQDTNYVHNNTEIISPAEDRNYQAESQKMPKHSFSDEAKTQEDADTEVSEINTQPINDYVQETYETYSRPMSTTSTTGFGKKKGEVAQVIAPYEATSAEQLTLQRGQLIMIRKKTDSGWWEGELQARGRKRQIGWFPATYVKVLQSGRLSGRSTPVSGGKIQMNEAILDKVIALYPYKAQNDDELSFEKDDIISVLGRDEPEWWRGDCQGLTGLFPSNYVGPFATKS